MTTQAAAMVKLNGAMNRLIGGSLPIVSGGGGAHFTSWPAPCSRAAARTATPARAAPGKPMGRGRDSGQRLG